MLTALVYARGLARIARPIPRWRVVCFAGGLALLLAALSAPVASLAERFFVAHMIQHILLALLAVPLVLLGAPPRPLLLGLPTGIRSAVVRPLARWSRVVSLHGLRGPGVAAGSYVVMLSVWHVPALYDTAVEDALVHVLEHATFVGTAALLWSQIIDVPPLRAHLGPALRIVLLLFVAAHGTVLGALLAFAPQPLYPYYALRNGPPAWITPLLDQQWSGAAMWMIGGTIYGLAIGLVFAAWMAEEERRGSRGQVRIGRLR